MSDNAISNVRMYGKRHSALSAVSLSITRTITAALFWLYLANVRTSLSNIGLTALLIHASDMKANEWEDFGLNCIQQQL